MQYLKNSFSLGERAEDLGRTGGKIGLKVEMCSKFRDVYGQYFQFPPGMSESVYLHISGI